MPAQPSVFQSDASRLNGSRSVGPVTDAGKARSAHNAVRHGLCGRTFFLLPDEDPAEFRQHEALWLATWAPRDGLEHEAALTVIRAMWREIRADRLEAQVLTDLFAAGDLADPAEAGAAKAAAFKALGGMLRYRGRIEREHDRAMRELDALRQRRLPRVAAPRPSEPEPAAAQQSAAVPAAVPAARLVTSPLVPREPEPAPPLNRHQRRALEAMSRRRAA
jgi:hypothetical protein